MLPLPMTPAECLAGVVVPTFRELLPGKFDSPEARVLLLGIGVQESDLAYRRQVGGPAMGLWQFEQGGGCKEVLASDQSRRYMRAVCLHRAVAPTEHDLYMALSHDDMLACATARLLLWCDPDPLPALADEQAAFEYYRTNWRPGAWKRDPEGVRQRWHGSYQRALAVVRPS